MLSMIIRLCSRNVLKKYAPKTNVKCSKTSQDKVLLAAWRERVEVVSDVNIGNLILKKDKIKG